MSISISICISVSVCLSLSLCVSVSVSLVECLCLPVHLSVYQFSLPPGKKPDRTLLIAAHMIFREREPYCTSSWFSLFA
jgi:hypothetical protein